jgi:hypothetical protein
MLSETTPRNLDSRYPRHGGRDRIKLCVGRQLSSSFIEVFDSSDIARTVGSESYAVHVAKTLGGEEIPGCTARVA